MDVSLMIEPHLGGTYQQQLEAARWAETEGLASFARCDHFLAGRDPSPDATDAMSVLAGLARDTQSIRLCVLVTPITFRHPSVIAKAAATIDQMSGGRFDLGVGTGWMELEHKAFGIPFPSWPDRWALFEEALDYLDAAFGAGIARFEGNHFTLDADVKPKPIDLRLVIGGGGPKRTPTLAGRRANEYNFFIDTPEIASKRIAVMREAAGGRPVVASVMGPAVVGRTETEYRSRLEAMAAERNLGSDEMEEDLVRRGIIVGTPGRAAEQIAALEEAGVQKIYVQWLDLDDLDTMKEAVSIVRG